MAETSLPGDSGPEPGGLPRRLALPVLALIGLCTGVEVLLEGADHRLWGSVLWRPLASQ